MESAAGGGKVPAIPASLSPRSPRYSLEDAVLNRRTREAVLEAIAAREHYRLVFEEWGLGKTHREGRRIGINLYGSPGTGKTMVAHGIASRLGKRIMCVNYADIESKFVGDTPKNLTILFGVAREADAVLFFDEADAILSRRLTSMNNATDTSVNQTRSVLLSLLNDFEGIVVFATNFISNYDPAFMRRMLANVRFELPDLGCRRELLERLMPPEMPTDAVAGELAAASEGLSGGDLANAVLMGALRGARSGEGKVRAAYILEAIASIRESVEANAAAGVPAPARPLPLAKAEAGP